jgi:hypothetical protein
MIIARAHCFLGSQSSCLQMGAAASLALREPYLLSQPQPIRKSGILNETGWSPHSLILRRDKGTAMLENSLAAAHNRVFIWPINSTPMWIYLHTNLYTYVHGSVIIITKVLSTNESKTWYSHTLEHYWEIKRNETSIHATAWIKLENTMLTKRSQSQKTTYYMIPFIM